MSSTHPEAVAALDIGTNTMLLLVGELNAQGDLRVVEDHCRTARLGEGLARAGSIAPQAFERGLAVLREYAQILQALIPTGGDVPRLVVANTIKGKGCPEMEGNPAWHHKIPTPTELESLIAQLT